jgi:transposase
MKRAQTPSFLLELPLQVTLTQAARLRAHFEAGRCLYNAILGESMRRLSRMRADPRWQEARAIPHSQKQERQRAFSKLRDDYGFTEYALHRFAREANCAWLADHLDAVTAQTIATRAYRAANRVALGQAKKVRFKSKGRGLDSLEGKRTDTGIRFVLQSAEKGSPGWLVWGKDRVPALIDYEDEVIAHGLRHRIKYTRIVRRNASGPNAKGADAEGSRYYVQLILEGQPLQKKKHTVGTVTVGLDLGPSVVAIVSREGDARLEPLGAELSPNARLRRRLQRKLDRSRRSTNPQNYDEQGRMKRQGRRRLVWKNSRSFRATQRRLATQERKLAAHRKSLHGHLVHDIIRLGNHIHLEKISYKGWQRSLFGKSVGLHAPGQFIARLKLAVASTGGSLVEFPTATTKLSQYCHGCHTTAKKPLTQRFHTCPCGVGPVQRDLYSAFLVAFLDSADQSPSKVQYSSYWKRMETCVRVAFEVIEQRAKAGEHLPGCVGIPRVRARRPASLADRLQEPEVLSYRRGRLEA